MCTYFQEICSRTRYTNAKFIKYYFQKLCSWTKHSNPKLIKNVSSSLVALLRFCFTKTTWKTKFSEFFLPLRNPLVDTFSEMCASSSRNWVAEQGIVMQNWSKTFQTFCSDSSIFTLGKQPEKLTFESFFTSKKSFGGYFQWNACTYFQKICSWTRYSNSKL